MQRIQVKRRIGLELIAMEPRAGQLLAAKEINEILVFGVRERGRLEGPSES